MGDSPSPPPPPPPPPPPSSSSASYIHMVQHLIEKCLIFHMSKEECMEALSKHAHIEPVITSTVWNELEKENKEFFRAYYTQSQTQMEDRLSEAETDELIKKMITESSSSSKDKKDSASSSKHPADTQSPHY